jgi:cytoplasmic iron level regulating protein YaaA (DUF328/UPF0246 family)
MTKILFLLPPSEWKNAENEYDFERLTFEFKKPFKIAKNVTEKDLKCKWDRFLEWLTLNKNIEESKTVEAIKRYSWVMYNAIDYDNMSSSWKTFFRENFLILSWMYWVLKPYDKIGNYKLPIETKWLLDFWWTQVLDKINNLNIDFVVNLLPVSYGKLILWKKKSLEKSFSEKRNFKIININFLKSDGKKISHWVKKLKWEWIKNVCEKSIDNYKDFPWEIIQNWNTINSINRFMN